MHFGLERMRRLLELIGDPQHQFRSIHVVGTNGKSSTVRMIAALLERHRHRTGAYLSPHLRSFAERIEIRERPLAAERFAAAIERVAAAAERVDAERPPADRVTQFEALTAAAYLELASSGIEIAVIEAGLGGRLDATNVIDSEVQVLTNVGLEHTAVLGSTRAQIAAEKLAVVPPGGTLVVGAGLHPEAARVARSIVAQQAARLVGAPALPSVAPALPGAFHRRNFALAETAVRILVGTLDPDAVGDAARSVRSPGRLEFVGRWPLTVVDGAHNPHGIAALIECLPELIALTPAREHARVVVVLSILEDKNACGIVRALAPSCHAIIATENSSPRSRSASELALLIRRLGADLAAVEPDPVRALASARVLAGPHGLVLATGSLALVGDLAAHHSRSTLGLDSIRAA